MFDLYALPDDFPGYAQAQQCQDPYNRVKHLENAFAGDINCRQFIPYIQLYEFEALILADPAKLSTEFLEHDVAIERLVAFCQSRKPELINDGRETAPSKRIIAEIPEFEGQKSSVGPEIARKIGLKLLREKCPHFGQWVTKLETLAQ